MQQQPLITLYDGRCGFCRWVLGQFLAWDRHDRLRPVPIQGPEGEALLPGLSDEQKLASWHAVTDDGTVHSGGAAFPPILRLLPGGRPLAAAIAAFPGPTNSVYRWIARNRSLLVRPVPRGSIERANERIERRAAAPSLR